MSEWTISMQTPAGPTQTTIVSLYRVLVSLRTISRDFVFNPDVNMETVRWAVAINRPKRLLPQPWPPVDTTQPNGAKIGTLLKMKAELSVKYRTQRTSSAGIQARVASSYPSIHPDEQSADNTLITATASLTEAGDVLFGFVHPDSGEFPLNSVADAATATIDYVTLMVICSISQDLETLGA